MALSAITIQQYWDPVTNIPPIFPGKGITGTSYEVSRDGTYSLDGNSAWVAGDIVTFSLDHWVRISNGVNVNSIVGTTTSGMTTSTVAPSVQAVQTSGYTNYGDKGGVLLKRVSAQPSHPGRVRSLDRYLPDGSVSAGNGGWWEYATFYLFVEQFGGFGGGVTNDYTAMSNCDACAVAIGGVVIYDAVFAFSTSLTLSAPFQIAPTGRFKPAASVKLIVQNSFTVDDNTYAFDFSAASSGFTFPATIISTGNRTYGYCRHFTPQNFGGNANGVADNAAAFLRMVVACMSGAIEAFLPAGVYVFLTPFKLDLVTSYDRGFTMRGAGLERTILDFRTMTPDGSDPYYAFWAYVSGGTPGVQASAYCVHPKFEDFMVYSTLNGFGIRFGRQDFTDALNEMIINQVGSRNFKGTNPADTSAGGIEMNFCPNLRMWAIANTATSGAGTATLTAYGTGLRLRQVTFGLIEGSYGNGSIGIHFTGGSTNGTVITAPDIENVKYCVWSDTIGASYVTINGGTANYYAKGIIDSTGSSNYWINPGINPDNVTTADWYSTSRTTSTGWNTRFAAAAAAPATTPTPAATGVPVYNLSGRDLTVTIYSANASSLAVNAGTAQPIIAGGSLCVPLPAGQYYVATFTAAIGTVYCAVS